MCVVCTLWEKGKLTAKEADKAFVELMKEGSMTQDMLMHAQEAIERIFDEDSQTKE